MRFRTIAALGLVALVATACFDDAAKTAVTDPTPAIAAAPAKVRAAGTLRIGTKFIFGAEGAQQFTLTGSGAMDLRQQVTRFAFRIPGAASRTLVYTSKAIYFEVPELLLGITDQRPWARINNDAGIGGGAPAFALSDPTSLLEVLAGTSTAWIDQGAETVRGIATRHYSVLVEFDVAEKRAPAGQVAGIRALRRGVNKDSVLVDAWLAPTGLVHRVAIDIGSGQTAARTEVDFYDLGERVRISVPRASETKLLRTETDISNFLTGYQSGA